MTLRRNYEGAETMMLGNMGDVVVCCNRCSIRARIGPNSGVASLVGLARCIDVLDGRSIREYANIIKRREAHLPTGLSLCLLAWIVVHSVE